MRRTLQSADRPRPLMLLARLALIALLSACGGGDSAGPTTPPPVTPAPVASIAVALGASSLTVGQSTVATAETRDASGAVLNGRTVTWATSNGSVATVTASGQVAAVAPGTSSISATSEGRTGSATVTVLAVPVASVVMSVDSTDIPIRTTGTLLATPRDAAGQSLTNRTVTWQSSAPNVATVSSTGVVNMLLPGTVTITATSEGRFGTTRVRGSVANLSALVDSIRQVRDVPALGAAIVSREGLVGIGVGGSRRISGGLPVTINDKWHIGSDTKAITGMLAGIAVDAGVLSWDRTVEQAFPDLAATTRAEYKTVTLRELMSHVGGLQNNFNGMTASTNLPLARTAWMNGTFQQVPYGPRGQYYYSNNDFGAAGAMIERAWNSSYESLISTRLLQPLGVIGAGWGPTTGVGGTDQPVGHQRVNNAWVVCEACDNPAPLAPAGTMHVPLTGWARITQELLLADQGRSALLTQATARVLTTNAVPAGGGNTYAMGWVVGSSTPGARWVGHDGNNTVNHARATVYLDAGVAYLIVTNASDISGGVSGAALTAMQTRLITFWNTGR